MEDRRINRNPYAQVISSLETNLKEAQVIKTFAMDEITGLKTDLISWIEKYNLLSEKYWEPNMEVNYN